MLDTQEDAGGATERHCNKTIELVHWRDRTHAKPQVFLENHMIWMASEEENKSVLYQHAHCGHVNQNSTDHDQTFDQAR